MTQCQPSTQHPVSTAITNAAISLSQKRSAAHYAKSRVQFMTVCRNAIDPVPGPRPEFQRDWVQRRGRRLSASQAQTDAPDSRTISAVITRAAAHIGSSGGRRACSRAAALRNSQRACERAAAKSQPGASQSTVPAYLCPRSVETPQKSQRLLLKTLEPRTGGVLYH